MAKISDDTAALVAAHLTQAWATIFAANPGAGGLPAEEMQARVWTIYEQFKGAATEVTVPYKYNLDNLT